MDKIMAMSMENVKLDKYEAETVFGLIYREKISSTDLPLKLRYVKR